MHPHSQMAIDDARFWKGGTMDLYLVRVQELSLDRRQRTTFVSTLATSETEARLNVQRRPHIYGIRGEFFIERAGKVQRVEPAGRAA
jgi:hypothetical protein